MNNFEKIKQMTVDEMARSSIPFFTCPYDIFICPYDTPYNDNCIACTKHWLESEANGD